MAARRYVRDNRGRFASVGATARGGRLATASGSKRATQTAKLSGGGPKGTVGKPQGLKPGSIRPKAANSRSGTPKVDISQSAFERRAASTQKRAAAAERAVSGLDRSNSANRRAFQRADSLRTAADSYSSYARRGAANPDFSAADLFKGRSMYSTAPKMTKAEKAAATRRSNAEKRQRENIRRMEQARRWG